MIIRAAVFFTLLSHALYAQEYLSTETALSDQEFYRLVACAAPPKGECNKEIVRWSKSELTVGITKLAPAYLGGKAKRAEAALQRAIQNINASGSGVTLKRGDVEPDISIMFLDIPARSKIKGSGYDALEGTPISGAGVRIFAVNGEIIDAVILFTTGLQKRAYESAMLEEITQGLGLMTDIGGQYYETRSIFSQSSNALKKLGKQDIMALGRHYPPR